MKTTIVNILPRVGTALSQVDDLYLEQEAGRPVHLYPKEEEGPIHQLVLEQYEPGEILAVGDEEIPQKLLELLPDGKIVSISHGTKAHPFSYKKEGKHIYHYYWNDDTWKLLGVKSTFRNSMLIVDAECKLRFVRSKSLFEV